MNRSTARTPVCALLLAAAASALLTGCGHAAASTSNAKPSSSTVSTTTASPSTSMSAGPPADLAGTTMLSVTQAGGSAQLTFAASKGQVVFIDVPATTLPNGCGTLTLLDPTGTSINSGCLVEGNGFVDATVLPAAGQYTFTITPGGTATGQASVKVVTVTNQIAAISLGGPTVAATIAQPGAVSRLQFVGVAGEKVRVKVDSATLPGQCGVLILEGPDGANITSGCIVDGAAELESVSLAVDGQYAIVVDPQSRTTGTAQVSLLAG